MRLDQSLRQWIVMGVMALGGAIVLGACSSDSKPNDTQCEDGTEGCACFGNGTCNNGLTCLSNLCVNQGSGGGAATGGSTGTGGTGAATGGSSPGTGGNGTGGESCGDTLSDPGNCGTCGRVCDEDVAICKQNCCVEGKCVNTLIGCFRETDDFETCSQYCASIGESCVTAGCYGVTWDGYGATSTECEERQVPSTFSSASCDTALPWNANSGKVRCTDNVP